MNIEAIEFNGAWYLVAGLGRLTDADRPTGSKSRPSSNPPFYKAVWASDKWVESIADGGKPFASHEEVVESLNTNRRLMETLLASANIGS